MVDANQAWEADEARATAEALAELAPRWLEEPLPADAPLDEWRRVAKAGVPLAAGENLRGDAAFDAAIAGGALAVVQPDAGKWGGITGCAAAARRAEAAGLAYCPHHLGGALGLLAAAHLLAAAKGGLLETDVNPNPLRSEMLDWPGPLADGAVAPPEGPGFGATPDLVRLDRWIARRGESRAG